MRGFAVVVESCIFIGNIPRNYGKLLEKFDEFPLKRPIRIVFEQGNATLASLRLELSKRNFVFLFLFYVAVNMIRQIKLAFVPNYYSGNFVKFQC